MQVVYCTKLGTAIYAIVNMLVSILWKLHNTQPAWSFVAVLPVSPKVFRLKLVLF